MTDTSNPHVLLCRDLTVGYKNKAVLSGLKLDFEEGAFISLLGPNGAGKTTLLRTLSRHLDPLGGYIEVLGRPLSSTSAMDLAKVMAVVLTDKVSPPLFTVFEFVALGRYPHTDFLGRLGKRDNRVVMDALASVHAEELAPRQFADLSDGERQKALVARALAQQPRLLLLDEPTIHLDLKHRVEVMAILRDLCRTQSITVVASLHDVDVAAKVSDRVALIKDGGLSGWGPPEAVLTGGAVADLYDFRGADFDRRLGSIELRGDGSRGRAFVAGGMGSGALVYRLLAKRGFSIVTGVLHENDLDFYVSRSLGADCLSVSPMVEVNGDSIHAAAERVKECDLVIDCGFEVGNLNQANLEIPRMALENGTPVFSLRQNNEENAGNVLDDDRILRCDDAAHLLYELDRRFSASGSRQKKNRQAMEAA